MRERNTAHVSYDSYTVLLDCVRSEERARGSSSAIAFIMQKHDMHHLVNNIWHGHSAVSENRDLFALKMVRYNMKEEWSPWNCILLTDAEARGSSQDRGPDGYLLEAPDRASYLVPPVGEEPIQVSVYLFLLTISRGEGKDAFDLIP